MRSIILFFSCLMFIALNACGPSRSGAGEVGSDRPVAAAPEDHGGRDMTRAPAIPPKAGEDAAIFAGGCFWCMEAPFDKLEGVISTTSGFTGGQKLDPTYEEVSSGSTGHAESIRVVFDPKKISYEKLLEVYWHNIDPTQADGQFCDHGNQYRSAIFYLDEAQRKAAEASKKALEASGKLPGPIVTEIVPASTFYPAENYHQDFYKKDPIRYHSYRFGCGRDRRLEQLWGGSGH